MRGKKNELTRKGGAKVSNNYVMLNRKVLDYHDKHRILYMSPNQIAINP